MRGLSEPNGILEDELHAAAESAQLLPFERQHVDRLAAVVEDDRRRSSGGTRA